MTAGYTTRVRGGSALVSRDYACPAHGPFDALVERNHAEERVPQPCPECGEPAELVLSAPAVHTLFAVSASRGRSDAKPHAMSLSTRAIAEGQPVSEWKAERKKQWQEHDRKQRKGVLD